MSKTDPPFRADHVGSLLRTPAIHQARARFRAGELDAAGLRAVEDGEIAALIPRLAATGIRSITDGEFRREWFHLDFLQQLGGITMRGHDRGDLRLGADRAPGAAADHGHRHARPRAADPGR